MGVHLLLMCAVVALPLEPLMAMESPSTDISKTKKIDHNLSTVQIKGEYTQQETKKLLTLLEKKDPLIEQSQKLVSARKLNELAEISTEEEVLKQEIAQKKLQEEARAKEAELQKAREIASSEKILSGESFAAHVSAYTAAADETGGSGDGITASGAHVKAGHTIACPKNYAFGTKIHFDGYGTYVCQDRGGAIKGNRFDMYMQTKSEAFSFGRRTLTARVVQ